MQACARGQVARGFERNRVCPRKASPPATAPQGGGGAPVLRPTLAGRHPGPQRPAASSRSKRAKSHDTANGASARGHHHRPASTEGGPPRVGVPLGCRGRWFGVRAQAPFAVSWLVARLDGVDGAARHGPHRVPRERGPENVPRATCPRAELGVRAAAKGRKGPNATPILGRLNASWYERSGWVSGLSWCRRSAQGWRLDVRLRAPCRPPTKRAAVALKLLERERSTACVGGHAMVRGHARAARQHSLSVGAALNRRCRADAPLRAARRRLAAGRAPRAARACRGPARP